MKFVELGEAEYREFEQKHQFGNLYQMAERADLRRRMGWEATLLGVKDGEKIVAVSLILAKKGMMMVPMGGVMDWEDRRLVEFWLKELRGFAKKKNAVSLEVFPPLKTRVWSVKGEIEQNFDRRKLFEVFSLCGFEFEGETTKVENKANRWVAVKDLGGFRDEAELRASYKKNVRNKLRKCSPELEIREVRARDGLAKVAEAINGSNEKNEVKGRDLQYFEDIAEIFGEKVRFVLATRKADGAAVAGRVIFDTPNETISFISGTVQKYRKMNAMTVLQDDLLTKCLRKGVKRVNFYGIEGDFSENNRLLEFKSGFGVKVEEYIGGFRMILRPAEYQKREVVRKLRKMGGKVKRAVRAWR